MLPLSQSELGLQCADVRSSHRPDKVIIVILNLFHSGNSIGEREIRFIVLDCHHHKEHLFSTSSLSTFLNRGDSCNESLDFARVLIEISLVVWGKCFPIVPIGAWHSSEFDMDPKDPASRVVNSLICLSLENYKHRCLYFWWQSHYHHRLQ